jgi:SAM-dependent methyltransferase
MCHSTLRAVAAATAWGTSVPTHSLVKRGQDLLRSTYRKFVPNKGPDKGAEELGFWKREYEREGGRFQNSWYERNMLAMAGEPDGSFLAGKIVADFGCGPRGSLEWATAAKERIGIDVLASAYQQTFDLSSHRTHYVNSTEARIPLPSASVDVLFTINAIDHVDDFTLMCNELLRILRPGGEFIGSFNLHEPATACEPQTLDEDIVKQHLLDHLLVKSYRVAPKGPEGKRYVHFWDGRKVIGREEAFLWVRATKPE